MGATTVSVFVCSCCGGSEGIDVSVSLIFVSFISVCSFCFGFSGVLVSSVFPVTVIPVNENSPSNGIHFPSTSVQVCPSYVPEIFRSVDSTRMVCRNSPLSLNILTSQPKTSSCLLIGLMALSSPTSSKLACGSNAMVVSRGPQSGSKSLAYTYQVLSVVTVKIRSICSPVFTDVFDGAQLHL